MRKRFAILVVAIVVFLGIIWILLQPEETDIFAQGKDATVSEQEVQRATEFYITSGMDEEQARRKAEDYMMEYEAMYAKAIGEGFQVTDEEVRAYVEELKETLQNVDNRDEVEDAIAQFESEEAYWEYEYEVYKKSLPIQKYVESLEKEYKEAARNKGDISEEEIEESWEEEFASVKREAVQEQEYHFSQE